MSAAAAAPHSDGEDEEEYRQPTKRLKTADRETEEREEGEEELEEGEDSDSGSLPGDGESAVDHRARWTSRQYRGGRKVRTATIFWQNVSLHHRHARRVHARNSVRHCCHGARARISCHNAG